MSNKQLPADVQETIYPIKWEVKSHSYQIADTGDYDGYWEITNGKDSLITKEDYDDIEKDLQAVVDLLNNTYANFTVDRGNEAALDAENKFLREELKKAQPGAMWVKGVPQSKDQHFAKVKSMIEEGVIYDAVIWPIEGSDYWWCAGKGFKFDAPPDVIIAHLDLTGAKAHELEQLRQWKMEAVELQIPIIAYVHKHLEHSVGDSCTALVIAELDRLRTENAALKADGDNLSRAARSLRLSVTAHPDYTGEENEEWTDLVEGVDQAIREWKGEKEVKP